MMNENTNVQQSKSNSVDNLVDSTIVIDTPLINQQLNICDTFQLANLERIDWNTSLISQICREGDIVRLRWFIEYSQQTISCGKHATKIIDRLDRETDLSPLHHAARYQQLHICLMLLSNIQFELGVNIKDEHGRTPIHSAFRVTNNSNNNKSNGEKLFDINIDFGNKFQQVQEWQEEYQRKILTSDHPLIYLFAKVKGNLNACDKYNLTPLHYAVAQNNLNGIKQLITFNVNIEAQDRQNMRPLHYACKDGYLTIVEYLIEKGAQIDVIDNENYTPLHYACAKGYIDIIKYFQSKYRIIFQKLLQMKCNTKTSCLHLAVQHGNIILVEYILKQFDYDLLNKLINEQAEPFGTPLHIAAKFCDPSLINLLYQYGANPLLLNKFNQSALHIACLSNRLEIVKELLSFTQKSLLEIKDQRGRTALSVTTNIDIIDELIKFGANISSCDRRNMNILMIAISNNQISIVEHLLMIINKDSFDIFNQITKRKHRSIFLLAVHIGSIRMCSILLNCPYIRWDTVDKNRMNIFHIAARNDHYELIEFLCNYIRKSIQILNNKNFQHCLSINELDPNTIPSPSPILRLYINAQNDDGKTPLHIAAEYGHRLSIESLLKYGADILIFNHLGQLSLHAAIQNGHSRCVEILLEISMKNTIDFQRFLSCRQSPLITACQNGFNDIVRLLLSHKIGINDRTINKNKNPLEIAIKYRQISTIYELLEQPYLNNWLLPDNIIDDNRHQTPLRTMIQYIPECAKHTFDKFIIKTDEIDINGNIFKKIIYNYKYIDDYFIDNTNLYDNNRRYLYSNHPFIIALDNKHYWLLEHPLAKQLLKRKWKFYSSIFYFHLFLRLFLLLILSFYVLNISLSNIKSTNYYFFILQWLIIIFSGINLLQLLLNIIHYRGLRVPFIEIIGLISFLTTIIAFIPFENNNQMYSWQWELASFSILFQWFNIAFESRPVPFIGNCIILFQSILFNFLCLFFITLPLLIAFTISIRMIFYNQQSFITYLFSIHKLFAMTIGEYEYEKLFFSKPTLQIASLIFIPFIIIMTIVFMNLLLGLTVGDIQNCMNNARLKAKAYRTREVIYIESTLRSVSKLRKNIIEFQIENINLKNLISIRTNDNISKEFLINYQSSSDINKLLDILNMLCTQAKYVLEKEIHFERLLKQLLAIRRSHIQ